MRKDLLPSPVGREPNAHREPNDGRSLTLLVLSILVSFLIVYAIILTTFFVPFSYHLMYSCYDENGYVKDMFLDSRAEKAGYPIVVWEQGPDEQTAHRLLCYRTGDGP